MLSTLSSILVAISFGNFSRNLNDLHLPVYLDPNLEAYYKKIADQKKTDLGTIINSILQKELLDTIT